MSTESPSATPPATPYATPDATPWELEDLLEALAQASDRGDTCSLTIERAIRGGGFERVPSSGLDFDPQSAAPGAYRLRGRVNGQWLRVARVVVAGTPTAEAPTAAHVPMDPLAIVLQQMNASAARQHEMLMAMLARPAAEGIRLADVLPLIKGPSSSTQVREMLELARDLAPGEREESGGTFGQLAAALAPMLAGVLVPGATPAPRPVQVQTVPPTRPAPRQLAQPTSGADAHAAVGTPAASVGDTTRSVATPSVGGPQPDTLARVCAVLRALHPIGVPPKAAADAIAAVLEESPESDALTFDALADQVCAAREGSTLDPDAFAFQMGIGIAGQFAAFVPELDRAWLDAVGSELVNAALASVDPEELRGLQGDAEAASILHQQGSERAAKAAAQAATPTPSTPAKGRKAKAAKERGES